MNIAYRVRNMQIAGTLSMALFGVVLVFGIMNCVLGYRLLRFWMMIFGFLIGAGIGLFAIHQIGFGEKMYYAVGMIGVGLVLAILSFAVFKAGILYGSRNWADDLLYILSIRLLLSAFSSVFWRS